MAIYNSRYIQRKVVGNLPVLDFFFQSCVLAFNLNRTLGPVVKYHIYLATSVSWQHGMLVIGYFGSKRWPFDFEHLEVGSIWSVRSMDEAFFFLLTCVFWVFFFKSAFTLNLFTFFFSGCGWTNALCFANGVQFLISTAKPWGLMFLSGWRLPTRNGSRYVWGDWKWSLLFDWTEPFHQFTGFSSGILLGLQCNWARFQGDGEVDDLPSWWSTCFGFLWLLEQRKKGPIIVNKIFHETSWNINISNVINISNIINIIHVINIMQISNHDHHNHQDPCLRLQTIVGI